MRDYFSRNVVGIYVMDGEGIATAADIVDHLGETLLDDPPPAPQVTGSIADRHYEVGSGPYTIDLDTKFSGATSYQVAPQPAGVSLSGAILTIAPSEPVERTTITVRGVAHGRQSEPITFALTVEAAEVDPPAPVVPDAPVLTLVGKTASTITVSWPAPADGGSAITSYRLYVGGSLAIANAVSPQ